MAGITGPQALLDQQAKSQRDDRLLRRRRSPVILHFVAGYKAAILPTAHAQPSVETLSVFSGGTWR